MGTTMFNENAIETTLVNVIKELHISYEEIVPWVVVYTEKDFENTEIDYACLTVNYDKLGFIYQKDGKLVAQNRFGVDILSYADSIEDAIRFLVKTYFRL